MSEPATKAGCDFESAPFAHVEFHIRQQNDSVIMRDAEVDIELPIFDLKEDLAQLFKIESKDQVWKYRDQVLDDDKGLKEYDVDLTTKNPIKIHVENKSY